MIIFVHWNETPGARNMASWITVRSDVAVEWCPFGYVRTEAVEVTMSHCRTVCLYCPDQSNVKPKVSDRFETMIKEDARSTPSRYKVTNSVQLQARLQQSHEGQQPRLALRVGGGGGHDRRAAVKRKSRSMSQTHVVDPLVPNQ